MIKSGLFLSIVMLGLACSNTKQPINIEIVPGISVSIPQKYELTISVKEDTVNYPKSWEMAIEDDHFAVYRYSIIQPDSLDFDSKKLAFKNNIDAFIKTFDFKNVDSTYQYKGTFLQSDIKFDYSFNGDDYKFFGKFLANKNNFIAFCFQTPFPVDNSSKSIQEKIFASIEIK
jgi:hypothetical protein